MLFSVEQVFVGTDEMQAPVKTPAWEATMEVKSVGTFTVILPKLATPPLPPQTKLNLEQNG